MRVRPPRGAARRFTRSSSAPARMDSSRTPASTTTHPRQADHRIKIDSATSGGSSASRESRCARSSGAEASDGWCGSPRQPPLLPPSTRSSASVSISGAMRTNASPMISASTPPARRHQQPNTGYGRRPRQLGGAADHRLDHPGRPTRASASDSSRSSHRSTPPRRARFVRPRRLVLATGGNPSSRAPARPSASWSRIAPPPAGARTPRAASAPRRREPCVFGPLERRYDDLPRPAPIEAGDPGASGRARRRSARRRPPERAAADSG